MILIIVLGEREKKESKKNRNHIDDRKNKRISYNALKQIQKQLDNKLQ